MVGKTVAIIPARGGSKGVPKKNIKPLGGKPLIAWTIEAALGCGGVERVVVSTDDPEIARIANEYGAETPFMRPPELARDDSLVGDVVEHALYNLTVEGREKVAAYLCLYPSHPFRSKEMLSEAVSALTGGVARFQTVRPIRNSFVSMGQNGELHPVTTGDACRTYYRPYGLVVGASNNAATNNGRIFPITDPVHLIDIDTQQDFETAERVLSTGLYQYE